MIDPFVFLCIWPEPKKIDPGELALWNDEFCIVGKCEEVTGLVSPPVCEAAATFRTSKSACSSGHRKRPSFIRVVVGVESICIIVLFIYEMSAFKFSTICPTLIDNSGPIALPIKIARRKITLINP